MNQSWTRRHLLVSGVTTAALLAAGCSSRGGTSAQSKGSWYVVQVGDTLASISQRSGISSQVIIDANQLDSRVVSPGRSLWLPGVGSQIGGGNMLLKRMRKSAK